MLIFLADTVHTLGRLNPDTVPYNIARIAAYSQHQFPRHEYRLFKDPHVLLRELRASRPDVLALSHYFWNTRLNHRIAQYARSLYPDLIIVTGGPNLDRDPDSYAAYATAHPYVDFVVVEEGETSFAGIIGELERDRDRAKSKNLPGTFTIEDAGVRISPPSKRVRALDDFPSPYLNGMLDPFLAAGLRPILETVRGCPYQCAFCEQGSEFFTKLAKLSEARVYSEIEYIRERTSASQLILADVNFGILKRDLEVARYLKDSYSQRQWPKSLYVYNAKQPTDTTLQTMETLYPMAQICMSFQSTDEKVLENIHRSNIGYDKYSYITKWAKARNIPVGTELIYGLPGETLETFVDGYETLLGLRADYMASYNLRVFPGIELNTQAKRREFEVRTRFRPMDVNLGEYLFENRERILEIEEVVFSTSTLSEDDFFRTRKLAFMVEALWNTGYLRPALAFLAGQGFVITEIMQAILTEGASSAASAFFDEYERLAYDELAEDDREFDRRCRDDAFWSDLVSGRGANLKLNLAFAGKLLLFKNPFDDFFYDFLRTRYASAFTGALASIFNDVLAHCRASKLDLDDDLPRRLELRFDVPEWIKSTYSTDLEQFVLDAPKAYVYALNPEIAMNGMAIKRRLERKGANFNSIAERIFMETPPFHRGSRGAVSLANDQTGSLYRPEEALSERVGWAT